MQTNDFDAPHISSEFKNEPFLFSSSGGNSPNIMGMHTQSPSENLIFKYWLTNFEFSVNWTGVECFCRSRTWMDQP